MNELTGGYSPNVRPHIDAWKQATMRAVQTILRRSEPQAFVTGVDSELLNQLMLDDATPTEAATYIVENHRDDGMITRADL